MKKTTLILLATASCLSLVACYTTPEMDELRYRTDYDNVEGGCSAQTNYMHEGLRNCMESTIEYEETNKKTVTILPTKKETIIIPRSFDDETMMDTTRIYERVDINDKTVVIEDGVAPRKALVVEVKNVNEDADDIEDEEDEEDEDVETDEVAQGEGDADVEAEAEPEEEPVKEEAEKVVEKAPEIKIEVKTTTKAEPEKKAEPVVKQVEEEPEPEVKAEQMVVDDAAVVTETEIVADPDVKVAAKVVAEPETIIEVEKKEGDVEIKKTVKVMNEKVVEEKKAVASKPVESEKPAEVSGTADSNANRTVTVVVKPAAKEDLVVSVDLGKEDAAVVEAKKNTVVTKQKKKTTVVKQERTKIEKNEKEVLPIEEK